MIENGGDIIGAVDPQAYLVAGWFSEDSTYRPLAESLAYDLGNFAIPFHLYAAPYQRSWDTRLKPTVALTALDQYPGKTVILMDVDCRVNGVLDPLANLHGDVGLCIRARVQRRRGRINPRQIVVMASSRVMVIKPFGGAVTFLREWQRLCGTASVGGDEGAMMWAYLNCPWVAYHQISPAYAAQGDVGALPGAIIEHDSAHDKAKARTWSGWLRGFEKRWLRTGRTARDTRSIPTV